MKKVVGYANAWSVVPGETLSIMVSTYGPERYRADLVRVICGDDDPGHGIYREEEIAAPFNGEYPGRNQPTAAGSYVTVADAPAIVGANTTAHLAEAIQYRKLDRGSENDGWSRKP